MRKPPFYHFRPLVSASKFDQQIMFFLSRFLDLLFLICFWFFSKMVDFGNPIRNPMGSKMAPKSASGAANLKVLALCELARSLFGAPNSGSTSRSIFNRFLVDLCSFFADFGADAVRFGMIFGVKVEPFRNLPRSARICQESARICQESAKNQLVNDCMHAPSSLTLAP